MNTLILTGWGWKDYACAAALALRKYPDAKLLGMSTRRLPEFLLEVKGYNNILILGVGLTGDPDMLDQAFTRLKKEKVRTVWISGQNAPESLKADILSKIEIFIRPEECILDVTSEYLRADAADLHPFLQEKTKNADIRQYHLLLEAAMYVYRNYQDEYAYARAIRHIANQDPATYWDSAEKQMVEHYKRSDGREIVGKSAVTRKLLDRINRVAPCDHARVMIFGESGTGKETVALQIHNKSPRRNEPYITFNCASVNPALLESRFYGYEKGAFTGASETKRSLFEQANGGTLFLDEIGELPLEAQGVLLRILEGGRFTHMGGEKEIETDVRLITATHRDLAVMVREGKFREDLFHRLNVVQIRVAPLREHKSDIEPIANGYWLNQHRRRLVPEQLEALQNYDYPGNVRELFNLLERAAVLDQMDFTQLIAEHKEMLGGLKKESPPDHPENLEEMIRCHVKRIHEKYSGNITRTAEALGVARNTVKKYLEE